ncbi:MAG: hypothetical protein GW906_06850 [Epsilonproteobacteria bacterium]|nr:hypothetical protein [Campylobacterota bacterium]PIP10806.1 MAG: hypothetical protein COX50_04210 [Sulfurimonas sp. CG23_combo_of_CG06-09_8_20_14_all_36_33]PIS24267.1 MAG: hypothetical protein COT46_10215 [Sulfurimonas sp. CG08_land_8_20_14_0_20_36_33]PIU36072.1 MAG: hypothetical protein COT05_01055 [Sulfurimonas sp. CG07_land_8_20_14_0_80_36_56]PIV04417.1 MAG: hypothetical protein COS56_05170 [Sulfurimonas sp. CG03_land_8_20_14_0_80_36_25]PIV34398.1 MAG: hypothetical protein COS32_10465 [S
MDRNLIADFKLITNGELDQILRISSAAKQAAMEEEPKSDSMNLDDTERSIISFCEREVQKANDLVYDKFSVFKQLMTKVTKAISNIESLKLIHETFRSEYQYNIRKNSSESDIIQQEYNLAKKDLYSFKSEHKLIRQEQSSTKPLLNWAIVLVIVFAESVLNASFFAKGSELGLLGGIVQAFVIVMINVLVANLVVLLIRRRNLISNSSIEKLGYTLLSGILIVATVCFHFLVGHYRDALRIDFENAYAFSVLNFSSSPFVLIDFESYILVVMGFLFFVVLIIDLYKLKDPYPGYGEITQKFNKIKQEYDALNFVLLDDEHEMTKTINQKIELLKTEATQTYEEIQDIHIAKQKLENKYNEHVSSIKNLAITAVKSYRSMNSDMRTTPKPAYFDNEVEFNPSRVEFVYIDNKEKTVLLESAIQKIPEYELEAKTNIRKIIEELKENTKSETM